MISFLTLVDLFAAQAILPSLAVAYRTSPAATGFAVNACTIGMAAAGLVVAAASRRVERRQGIGLSLALLSVPTALLALAPNLAAFTALRIAQGVFMSSAFTLTMAYLAERCGAREAAAALAAYVTGNVAANLVGRLASAAVAEHLGLAVNFLLFAGLNVAGAALAAICLSRVSPMVEAEGRAPSPIGAWRAQLRDPALGAAFAIGFLILFAFIGTFTYVNFALVQDPIALSPMGLGLIYFVFLPSLLTTPLAGRLQHRLGTRPALWTALALALAGLPLLLLPSLPAVLLGLALVGIGTFLAQATATGFVSRAPSADRGTASGLYLASYYLGGLVGSALLGQVYGRFDWTGCVAGVAVSLLAAGLLAVRLEPPSHTLPRPSIP